MRYPPNIHKIEREMRQKKHEEMSDITSPLIIKREMKPYVFIRQKNLPELRESRLVERKGEVMSENMTEAPKYLSESREIQPKERKDEASLSSSMV